MRRFALTMTDGELRITEIHKEGLGINDVLAKWHPDELAKVVFVREMTQAQFESIQALGDNDRYFRRAWKDGGNIVIDMVKARAIHRQVMRNQRAKHFVRLDADYLLADENGDAQAKKAIAQKKKALRDVTAHPSIDAATTPAELRAIWPFEAL